MSIRLSPEHIIDLLATDTFLRPGQYVIAFA